jgi:hypothetical protein
MWDVLDPSVSVFSLSSYRHPFIYTVFMSRFTVIINNNKSSHSSSRWPSGPRWWFQVTFLFGGCDFEPRFRYNEWFSLFFAQIPIILKGLVLFVTVIKVYSPITFSTFEFINLVFTRHVDSSGLVFKSFITPILILILVCWPHLHKDKIKPKGEESTCLTYTGFLGEMEHLKIETRLIDEKFASMMGECVIEIWWSPHLN